MEREAHSFTCYDCKHVFTTDDYFFTFFNDESAYGTPYSENDWHTTCPRCGEPCWDHVTEYADYSYDDTEDDYDDVETT